MELRVGQVTHYFGKIQVAVMELTETLEVGDTIHFHGHTTDFSQEVASMQIDHKPVESAGKGQEIAIKVRARVRVGDEVFKA